MLSPHQYDAYKHDMPGMQVQVVGLGLIFRFINYSPCIGFVPGVHAATNCAGGIFNTTATLGRERQDKSVLEEKNRMLNGNLLKGSGNAIRSGGVHGGKCCGGHTRGHYYKLRT